MRSGRSIPSTRGQPKIAVVTVHVVPAADHSLKYTRLGAICVRHHREYCTRRGYDFHAVTQADDDRPACWAKIPATLDAMDDNDWILWADADSLVLDPSFALESVIDDRYDLVSQCPVDYFSRFGWDESRSRQAMPLNTGVMLLRSSDWTRRLLERAFERTEFVSNEYPWNGIGEQEAIVATMGDWPGSFAHVGYARDLQCHPKWHQSGAAFLHFYGNYATHLLPLDTSIAIIDDWETALRQGKPPPHSPASFHWSCIQNTTRRAPIDRGGPERFLYAPDDIRVR